MLDVEALLRPYYDTLAADLGGLALFDAHTHIGANDPDGFSQTPEELLEGLERAGARARRLPDARAGRLPGGQRRGAPGGRRVRTAGVVAFCRVDPRDDALAEAERCLTPARAGSSSTRAPSSSRCPSRRSATWSRSPTSGGRPC